jgi:hypothetical protein
MRKTSSSSERTCVSLNQVSYCARESPTWSSPRAAVQSCLRFNGSPSLRSCNKRSPQQPSRDHRPRHTEGKPWFRPPVLGSPRTIPQGEVAAPTAMLMCTHRRFLIVLFQREKGLDLEAHLSAEDPPTCACAWVSLAHEDHRRPSSARRASRAWPQAPHRRLAPRHSWTPRVCGGIRTSPRCGAKE